MATYFAPLAPHVLEVADGSLPRVLTRGFSALAHVLWRENTEIPGYRVLTFEMRKADERDAADVVVDMQVSTDSGSSTDTLYFSVEAKKIVGSRHVFGSAELARLLMREPKVVRPDPTRRIVEGQDPEPKR